jgi:hypothetical protein
VPKAKPEQSKSRFLRAVLAAGCLTVALPSTVLAIEAAVIDSADTESEQLFQFTPAKLDLSLVQEVAANLGSDALRFTPAARPNRPERTVTMAVRVDDKTALAMSVRSAGAIAGANPALGASSPTSIAASIAPTRYDLGIARGYQGFAAPAPKALALPSGIRDISMPDLSEFGADEKAEDSKPSRFQTRIALENERTTGSSLRTAEGAGVRSVDVGGSFRVAGNLNVTAGVRLAQERDRLDPLTDGIEDSQAVYVGTQFKF